MQYLVGIEFNFTREITTQVGSTSLCSVIPRQWLEKQPSMVEGLVLLENQTGVLPLRAIDSVL